MFVCESLKVNPNGNLEIGGCDCVALAQKYGTPLYVMDEEMIRKNCRTYKNSIEKHYDGNGLVLYASKAFSCKAIYRIAKEEGLGIDVVSGGELYTALSVGFPVEKIYFHGNNKTADELCMALENDIGRIVVDNIYELELLDRLAREYGKRPKILFRIKPGIDAHTHSFIRTGQIDSKFGVALETGEAREIIAQALKLAHVEVVGVHCHIGSQIFDSEPFQLAAERLADFIASIRDEFGITLRELNLGGGYGIKYLSDDQPISYDCYIEKVSTEIKRIASEKGVELPFVLMEPGRSIVGEAGITLYTVGAVKDIPGVRKYVSVDGGMGDNPRYALYQAEYEAAVANRPAGEPRELVTVVGKYCESGDILIKDIELPRVQPGDTLAVLSTGAYNYSMASNYNRMPRPAVVMVNQGRDTLIVRRESYEDLIRNDL